MEKSLSQIFKVISATMAPRKSFVDEGVEKLWLPILLLNPESSDFYMGITEDGEWCLNRKSGLVTILKSEDYLYAKIILELSFSDVSNSLKKLLRELNLNENNSNSIFPFINIVRAVFEEHSSYWLELALNWYSEFPFDWKIDLKDSLEKLNNNKSVPQKLRQRVHKEIKILQ